jgi:NitT/TauT family transport system permease protein
MSILREVEFLSGRDDSLRESLRESLVRRLRSRAPALIGQTLTLVTFLGAWQWASGRLVAPVYVSSPSGMVGALQENFDGIMTDTVSTVSAALEGLAAGLVLGVAFGYMFARARWLSTVLNPFMLALNSLPRPALAPLFVIWFGLGQTSKVLLSFSIVFFLVFYNTYAGVENVSRIVTQGMQSMGASRWQVFRFVVMPSITSWVFAALRLAVAYSMFGAIVAELAGSTEGLGYRLMVARGLLQTDEVFAILLVLVVVSVSLTLAAKLAEDRILRWRA